jgi:hypothetical protein
MTLDSLNYFDTIKSVDKKKNLMKFLAECIKECEPKIYSFWESFICKEGALKIDVTDIDNKKKDFQKGLTYFLFILKYILII